MKRVILFMVFTAGFSSSLFSQIDKLNPIFFTTMSRRFENGSVDNKIDRLITPTAPSTNIRIVFLKGLMREGMTSGNLDSIQNKMRVLNSYIGVLQKERDDNLSRLGDKSDSQKILDKYAEPLKAALAELAEIQAGLAAMTIGVRGTVILGSGKQYPLEIPNYFQSMQSDSGYCTRSKTRSLSVNSKGDVVDDVVDVEINLTGENLSEGDQVKIVVEATSRNSSRQLINYFRIEPVGWNVELRPSLGFIKRAGHSNTGAGSSNFKPAAGASLLYSCFSGAAKSEKLWKNFSLGINVSFVDFDPTHTIEVGVGLIAYGFNSSIGFGYGWNIHTHSGKGFYIMSIDLLRLLHTAKNIYTGREG